MDEHGQVTIPLSNGDTLIIQCPEGCLVSIEYVQAKHGDAIHGTVTPDDFWGAIKDLNWSRTKWIDLGE